MDEWHVGDPIGFGNDISAPEVPYMSYGPRRRDVEAKEYHIETPEEKEKRRKKRASEILSEEAWRLNLEKRYSEVLVLIDVAIENDRDNDENWNVKGIIFNNSGDFEQSLSCYNRALELKPSGKVIMHNKALCLIDYSKSLFGNDDMDGAMVKVNQALELIAKSENMKNMDAAYDLKAQILVANREYGQAFECYKNAVEIVKDNDDLKSKYKQKRDFLLKYIECKDAICPRCGHKVPITDNFCIRCGNPMKHEYKNKPSKSYYGDGVSILDLDEDI